jgi:exodeoxyribonuclease VII large subunit
MLDLETRASTGRIWQVGALCRAVADALQGRFGLLVVQGELSGFTRAASGHCYFTLKDAQGALRCAMFRRAAMAVAANPAEGARVELRARLDVYGPRGDLQLIVESLQPLGQGALMEQFLRTKARLEAEGLFDPARKRPVPTMPRVLGLVTSLQAAALHDVLTALRRRAPHVRVLLAPAPVQGADAPRGLIQALQKLYLLVGTQSGPEAILLVRGGGSLEDLAAFNDEALARVIAQSPVPVISGVGHETDFSIADFVADLRAPTPTAAAELAATPQAVWIERLGALEAALQAGVHRALDQRAQALDLATRHLLRPTQALAVKALHLQHLEGRLRNGSAHNQLRKKERLERLADALSQAVPRSLQARHESLRLLAVRLQGQNPEQVLQRGYAWVARADGSPVVRAAALSAGDGIRVRFADGEVAAQVSSPMSPVISPAGSPPASPQPGTNPAP